MKIILGTEYSNYEDALENVNEEALKIRRDNLSLRFAQACLKNHKFKSWFQEGLCTRSGMLYCEPQAKTRRYRHSAIPYLTKLLNSKHKTE